MAQHLKFLLAFVLMCAVQAQAGNVIVINMGSSTRSFKYWKDGSYVNQPPGWKNIAPGASGITPSTDGALIQAQAANAPDDFCYPTNGVSGSGGTLIYMGTNTCVEVSANYYMQNNGSRQTTYAWYFNGVEFYDTSPGDSRYILDPGQRWDKTFLVGYCKDGTHDEVVAYAVDSDVRVISADGGFTFTNVETLIPIGSSGTNNLGYGTNTTAGFTSTNLQGQANWTVFTNGAINFAGTSATAAKDDTLKVGFNALMGKLSDIKEAVDINSAIGTLATDGSGGETGVVSAVQSFHHDNTNLLGGILSELVGTNESGTASNSGYASGSDAGAAGKSQLDSITDGIPLSTGDPGSGGLGGAWQIGVSLAGTTATFDLNPFTRTWVNDLANLCRKVVAWFLLMALALANAHYTITAIQAAGSARQATAAVSTPLVGSASAAAMAIAMTVALGTIPTFAYAWFTGNLGTLGSAYSVSILADPFTGVSSGSLGDSLYMVNRFLPLGLFIVSATNAFVFRITMGGILWLAQTVVRFLVG